MRQSIKRTNDNKKLLKAITTEKGTENTPSSPLVVVSSTSENVEVSPVQESSHYKEFAEMPLSFSDFTKMLTDNFSFKLRRTLGDEKELKWDLRITYYSPRTLEGGKKTSGPLAKITFGRYFRKNAPGYQQLFVGDGTPFDKRVMLALFDTDHPHLKNSADNIAIKVSGKGIMGDLNSLPVCYTLVDFFGLKLPSRVDVKVEYYFTLHKMAISNSKAGNFVVEHIELKTTENGNSEDKS